MVKGAHLMIVLLVHWCDRANSTSHDRECQCWTRPTLTFKSALTVPLYLLTNTQFNNNYTVRGYLSGFTVHKPLITKTKEHLRVQWCKKHRQITLYNLGGVSLLFTSADVATEDKKIAAAIASCSRTAMQYFAVWWNLKPWMKKNQQC